MNRIPMMQFRNTNRLRRSERLRRHRFTSARGGSQAVVFIITLWIVLSIAALVLIFSRAMRVETISSSNEVEAIEAQAIAQGALQYVMAQVDGTNGMPPDPTLTPCEAVQLGTGYFWILQPPRDGQDTYSFDIVDEASKLNLNTATEAMLVLLPNMTPDVADNIVAWRTPATANASGGAQSDYYLSLPDPYNCKNSDFETVEELLLVEGVTPQLLFGEDTNQNGVLDPNETGGTGTSGLSDTGTLGGNGNVDMGWFPYLTVWSYSPPTSTGTSGRSGGAAGGGVTGSGAAGRGATGSGATGSGATGAGGRGSGAAGSSGSSGSAGGTGSAATAAASNIGLINVNTAQQEVLMCLPGLNQNDVSALMSYRASSGVNLTSTAWVAQAIGPTKAAAIASYITVASYQFSADIVAVTGDGRAFKRYRLVLDATESPPTVLYWKDITYLGWPLSPDIRTTMQSGGAPPDAGAITSTSGGNPS